MTKRIVYPKLAQMAVALLLTALTPGLAAAADSAAKPAVAKAAAQAVQLIVDFGDGVEVHYTRLPWKEGMTALDALAAATKPRHAIRFEKVGSGVNTKVTSIDELANEGGGRTRKNWMFYVNRKKSDVGSGAAQLGAGDVVLWRFERFDYNRP